MRRSIGALAHTPWCTPKLVHTGQHYDDNMSDSFIRDLGLPAPDYNLGIGSGSHAEQTAGVMVAYERLCGEHRPDLTVVVGDVNSTMACTLAAKKLLVPVAHLEAGLRSRDWTMPEEINRVVTDSVADVLWTPSEDADENLRHEGISEDRVTRVGNIMIDSYELMRPQIDRCQTRKEFGLGEKSFGVATLHRPANVDDKQVITLIVSRLRRIAREAPIVFSLHPRTRKNLIAYDLLDDLEAANDVHLTEPMNYVRFMGLVRDARFVITDSGGLQEETTYLNIPCLTLRPNTERPITVSQGTNHLVTPENLGGVVAKIFAGDGPSGVRPELWDGETASRVVADIARRNPA